MPPEKLLSRKEYENFLKSLPKNICSFCENKKYQIILKEWKHWIWIVNLFPYWHYHTLLFPKRHIKEFSQLTIKEMEELKKITIFVIGKYKQKKLRLKNGDKLRKYVFFWRLREDNRDLISGNIRPNHFHIHIAPDKDHLWDPIIDSTANQFNFKDFLKQR